MKNTLNERKKSIRQFMIAATIFVVPFVLYYFTRTINAQDTSVFAFSYKYGFISRGLLGTIWQWLDGILPFTVMNFWGIYRLSQLVTIIYYLSLLLFYYIAQKYTPENDMRRVRYLIVLLSVFAYPMFLTWENFGRLDEYLMIITILSMVLIIIEKAEWLIIPMCIVAMLLHQGFVFLEGNIILVLLFYKWMMSKEHKKKYGCIFILTALSVSVLFIYFEFFGHVKDAGVYEEVVALAKSLSQDGMSFSESLLNHEILGQDVSELEWAFHGMNKWELPLNLLFYWPYVAIGVYFFGKMLKFGDSVEEKLAYLAVVVGAITVLPEVILKVDLGRYFFSVLFYYIGILICLIAMGDKKVAVHLENLQIWIKEKIPVPMLLIAYPIVLMPFLDIHPNQMLWDIVQYIWNIIYS